ncbi:MAG: dihydroorotate dehydrogenase [Candidatus Thermoplasmatota archaeon]
MVELKTDLLDYELDIPLILASGILDQTAATMERIAEKGMGAIVTKSIGKEPKKGHPNPTVAELETGLLNAMGLPNPGIEDFKVELNKLQESVTQKPIIGSIFASNPEDFGELAHEMADNGADMIELNLSCPHAEGYGASIASDDETMTEVIKKVKEVVDEPVLSKLPPSTEIDKKAVLAEESGSDGIVCINTVRAMAINFETQEPILGNKIGGYSGKGIKPIGLRCVFEVYKEVDIPIIGCGGVTTGRDALEYMLAGATALQLGTSIHSRGKKAPEHITEEMRSLMEKEDIENIDELIGRAQKE